MLTQKLKNLLPPKYWKKAGGEMLSFAIIIPCILMMVFAIISATQIGYINQTLNYCAYNAGRAAVICDSEAVARQYVLQTYQTQFGMQNMMRYGYSPFELEILNGDDWEKGAFIKCTVRYYVRSATPFTSGVREQSIVMMIENGDV